MIKFFRHIRQRMIKENKVSKYLLYAIGEIVLVVIGILIALQINNNNEQRKVREKEQTYLAALQEEFIYNQSQLEKVMSSCARFGDAAKEILKHTGPDEPSISEEEFIGLFLGMIASEVQYRPSNGVLEEIISSGKLEIFQDPQLRELLSSWDGILFTVRFQEQETNDARMEVIQLVNFDGNVRQLFQVSMNEIFELTPSKFENENRDLLRSHVFESRTTAFLATTTFTYMYYYPKIERSINEILELIDQELEQ